MSITASEESAPVLIVGGGLAGLSAAMFLSWRGVSNVIVERHPGSSLHPRAVGFTTRTLELFRGYVPEGISEGLWYWAGGRFAHPPRWICSLALN